MAEGPKHQALVQLVGDPKVAVALARIALQHGAGGLNTRTARAARETLLEHAVVENLGPDPRSTKFSHLGEETGEGEPAEPPPEPVDDAEKEPPPEQQGPVDGAVKDSRKKKGIRILDADVVKVFRRRTQEREPVLLLNLEVQNEPDDARWAAWQRYKAEAHAQLDLEGYPRCPAKLAVCTLNDRTAKWALRGWSDDQLTFKPYVIGPGNIPVVDTEAQAQDNPALAVLSSAANPRNKAVAKALKAALKTLSAKEETRFLNLLFILLPEDATVKNSELVELESNVGRRAREQAREQTREEIYEGMRDALVTRLVDYHSAQGRALSEAEMQQIRDHLKALGGEQIMKAIAARSDEAFLQALQLA